MQAVPEVMPAHTYEAADRLSLSDMARLQNVHPSTAVRWCLRGCRGVKLPSFLIGGRRFTTLRLFHEWVDATAVASVEAARTGPKVAKAGI